MIVLLSAVIFILTLTAVGAGQTPPPPPERPGSHNLSYYDPKGNGTFQELSVLKGSLELEISKDTNEIRGTFTSGSERVTFVSAELKETRRVKVNVQARGLNLNADIDFSKETVNFGGEVTKERSAIGLSADDRTLLFSTLRAAEERRRTKAMRLALSWEALEKSLALWSEWPDDLSLSQSVGTKKNRSLCEDANCITATGPSYFGMCIDSSGNSTYRYYEFAQHDCNNGDLNNHVNQQRVSLGAHTSCPGEEWYWDGSKWECGEPDHWNRPYVQGNCFGRCGPGCGMIGIYTVDCTNHDGCVRNGHSLASVYCNDQFVACIDDTLFGEKCYESER